MTSPRDLNDASSDLGKASLEKEDDLAVKPAARAEGIHKTGDDDDLELPESVFRRRTSPVPASLPQPDFGAAPPKDMNPAPADSKEVREKPRKKNPLEKKNAVNLGQAKFNRFVTRPEAAHAARVAIENSRSESPVDLERVGQEALHFGKNHRTASSAPAYRPNKLFTVLDSIYVHSPLKWLDTIERAGPRFIVGSVIALLILGGVGWIFFQSLTSGTPASGTVKEVQALSAGERVERATKAVQEVVQGFAGAESVDARLRWVVAPDQARDKMQNYYGQQQGTDPKIVSWSVGSPVPGPQGDYLPLTIEDSTGTSTTLVMEETDQGVRIDWENLIAYGDQNWQDFCARRPIPPAAMRVQIRKSEHYEGVFSKERYQAYDIEHRSGPPRLTGYVLREDRVAQSFADLCKDDQWHAANVWLRFESGTGADNLVRIEDLTATRWQDQAVKWKRRQ